MKKVVFLLSFASLLSACHSNDAQFASEAALEEDRQLLRIEAPQSDSMPACRGMVAGTAFLNGAETRKPLILPLGTELKFAVSQSPDLLRTAWIFQVPGSLSPLVSREKSIDVKPAYPGLVSFSVVSERSDGKCESARGMVGIQYQEPLRTVEPNGNPTDSESFSHLNRLGVSLMPGQGRPGESDITVAILDTGVNYNHPDLNTRIVAGWDFVDGDDQPFDDQGHGTHVAGLVAGLRSGVSHHARILPVRVLNTLGQGKLKDIDAGIRYAADRGARVMVLAFGLPDESAKQLLSDSIQYAGERGAVVFAAAGNQGRDLDLTPFYPAALKLGNLVTVAAQGEGEGLASYSNFGVNSVDIAAPGGTPESGGLLSTSYLASINQGYERHWGTSMAAPLVAGLAAELIARDNRLTAAEVRSRILEQSLSMPELGSQVRSGKKAWMSAALQ